MKAKKLAALLLTLVLALELILSRRDPGSLGLQPSHQCRKG